ncbi:hypothetical protein HN51_053459 [Arachis hypogaea]|uniref:uncharacterized protein LOC107614862 n=1 Tax=Arachis ipaensis TaxID=130454 RepID=UPI0007AFC2D6|nr:uncharacterized protein LOC107614862 [Arachis ipaensis]XP_025676881.1 uncharacterized protein LOC112776834 [Arachis hypogaea]
MADSATRLSKLVNQRFEDNNQISSTPKIQRVPVFLHENPNFYRYCTPKMISFGPIHHRNENLKQQEHLKSQWTWLYIEEYTKQVSLYNGNKQEAANYLYGVVGDNIGELKELFAEDVVEGYSDEELIWMLFEDGCSLLYYMEHVDDQCPEELRLKLDQLMYTWRDILLLENQLPVKLLQLLSAKKGADLEYLMLNFLGMGDGTRSGTEMVILGPTRNHILDFVRSFVVDTETEENIPSQQNGGNQMPPPPSQVWQTYKNIRDLKNSGIQVKKVKNENEGTWKWHKISFTSRWFSGELTLPCYVYNDVTIYLFRNFIAYEMCPDFRNTFECCSFFSFMDSLIDDAEDVKELRSAGVIQNLLRSDQELAEFLNDITHDLPTKMFNQFLPVDAAVFSKKYIQVKFQIEKHYSNTWKTWLAEARSTYFNSPWSLLAVLAAFTALVLTFIQTWYAMHPNN